MLCSRTRTRPRTGFSVTEVTYRVATVAADGTVGTSGSTAESDGDNNNGGMVTVSVTDATDMATFTGGVDKADKGAIEYHFRVFATKTITDGNDARNGNAAQRDIILTLTAAIPMTCR